MINRWIDAKHHYRLMHVEPAWSAMLQLNVNGVFHVPELTVFFSPWILWKSCIKCRVDDWKTRGVPCRWFRLALMLCECSASALRVRMKLQVVTSCHNQPVVVLFHVDWAWKLTAWRNCHVEVTWHLQRCGVHVNSTWELLQMLHVVRRRPTGYEKWYPQNIFITFVQYWTSVEEVGPTLYTSYTNVLCLLGIGWKT